MEKAAVASGQGMSSGNKIGSKAKIKKEKNELPIRQALVLREYLSITSQEEEESDTAKRKLGERVKNEIPEASWQAWRSYDRFDHERKSKGEEKKENPRKDENWI